MSLRLKRAGQLAWVVLVVICLLLEPAAARVHAQDGAPRPDGASPTSAPGGVQLDDGSWAVVAGEGDGDISAAAALDSGGPDDYGYTWSNVPSSWVDVRKGGTDAGLSGDAMNQATGAITLPFDFKYYENTYNQVWIAGPGYVSFAPADYWYDQVNVRYPTAPNNIVVPYSAVFTFAEKTGPNRVYYKSGGTAPNRFFAVEWYKVQSLCCSIEDLQTSTATFEVLLYESGDILFQYETMQYANSWFCSTIGIEDSYGTDGLEFGGFCNKKPSNWAAKIVRPAPQAARVSPSQFGRFTKVDAAEAFPLTITNIGEKGADTYDLSVVSAWPAQLSGGGLSAAELQVMGSDEAGIQAVALGPLAQGQSVTILVTIQSPRVINVGDANAATVTARSRLDATKQKSARIVTTQAVPFAQILGDATGKATSVTVVEPGVQNQATVATKNYDISLCELPGGGYLAVYDQWMESAYAYELYAQRLDATGKPIGQPKRLTDSTAGGYYTNNSTPAVATAANGRSAIVWRHYVYDYATDRQLANIFSMIVDETGSVVAPPVNETNNTEWRLSGSQTGKDFYRPQVAVIADDRFVMAWERLQRSSSGYQYSVDYGIRTSGGEVVRSVGTLAPGVGSTVDLDSPALAGLVGGGALVVYMADGTPGYAVMDSGGAIVKSHASVGSFWGYESVAKQLSDGRIAIGWIGVNSNVESIRYALIDGSTKAVVVPEQTLAPLTGIGISYLSLTTDLDRHAIFTWGEAALADQFFGTVMDSGGNIIAPAMPWIQVSNTTGKPSALFSSNSGYGAATDTRVKPLSNGVNPALYTPLMAGGAAGGVAPITLDVQNLGLTAASLQVMAELPAEVKYVSAFPAPTSVVTRTLEAASMEPVTGAITGTTTVTWTLSSMGFQGVGRVELYTTVPDATIGSAYPVTLTAIGGGLRSSQVVSVTVVHAEYLPTARRW